MRRFLQITFFLFSTFFSLSSAFSQNNFWTGGTGDWGVAANWSLGVPTTAHEVRIEVGDYVTIPAGYNAIAKSVKILNGNGSLTIAATGSLTIDDSSATAFTVNHDNAVFSNSGTLNIGKTTAPMAHGIIFNKGTFTNNNGGVIDIGSTTLEGIVSFNTATKTLNNSGTIKIGTTGNVRDGIKMGQAFIFNNLSGSVLEIDNTTGDGIEWNNVSATFNNHGTVEIGQVTSITNTGVNISNGTFDNKSGATLTIDKTTLQGLIINNATATFTNSGIVNIGKTTAPSQHGIVFNNGSFTNNSGATIDIGSATSEGITSFNGATKTLNNSGTIKIGTTGNVRDGIKTGQPFIFNNLSGSVLEIDNTTGDGIEWNNASATFNNEGIVRIGSNMAIGAHGINLLNSDVFDNKSGSVLEIDRTTNNGVYLNNSNADFTNAGTIKIGSNAAIAGRGIIILNNNSFDNQSGGIIEISNLASSNAFEITGGTGLTNTGSITFGKDSQVRTGLSSSLAVSNSGTMVFNLIQFAGLTGSTNLTNNSGAIIEIPSSGTLQVGASATLTNDGIIKGEGTLHIVGAFTNSATSIVAPGASPGKLTVTGAFDFGGGAYNCEINGTAQGMDPGHDWLSINGAATLTNASLVVDWGAFMPIAGQSYIIMTFASRTDEFSTITIPAISGLAFTPTHNSTNVVISVSAVLPVELTDFRASLKDEKIVFLHWQTASETNNQGFEVEHSTSGKDWRTIGFINGNGTSAELNTYQYHHESTISGINYYRLKQMDFDGTFEYSDIASVAVTDFKNKEQLNVFPNPVKDGMVTIQLDTNIDDEIQIQLFDLTGKMWLQQSSFDTKTEVNVQTLPAGIYVAAIYTNGQTMRERIVVE